MKIIDLLNQIIWDTRLDRGEFFVEYEDRFAGPKRLNLGDIEVDGFMHHGDSVIPIHRVRKILWKDVVVFDREWVKKSFVSRYLGEYGLGGNCRFEIVPSGKLDCKADIVSNAEVPVIVRRGDILNCSVLGAYKKKGTPIVPALVCD